MKALVCWVCPYRNTDDVKGEKYSCETFHVLVIRQPVQLIQIFFLIVKSKGCTNVSNLFLEYDSLISQIYFWNRTILEFYSKNKFDILVHLVGFIIRIYHDARFSECQINPKL